MHISIPSPPFISQRSRPPNPPAAAHSISLAAPGHPIAMPLPLPRPRSCTQSDTRRAPPRCPQRRTARCFTATPWSTHGHSVLTVFYVCTAPPPAIHPPVQREPIAHARGLTVRAWAQRRSAPHSIPNPTQSPTATLVSLARTASPRLAPASSQPRRSRSGGESCPLVVCVAGLGLPLLDIAIPREPARHRGMPFRYFLTSGLAGTREIRDLEGRVDIRRHVHQHWRSRALNSYIPHVYFYRGGVGGEEMPRLQFVVRRGARPALRASSSGKEGGGREEKTIRYPP